MNGSPDPATTRADAAREMWAARVSRYARDGAPQTQRFAAALLDLTAPVAGEAVLDIATGTGVVAVGAAERVGAAGRVVATDFVAEWAPYVAANAAAAGADTVTFEVMSAEALALPDAAFDVVLCQFGLMFVPDKLLALREMRRVLRPGGRLGLAVWSVPERVGLFLVSGVVGAALPPQPGPQPPSPLSLGAPGLVERLVAEAGFSDVQVRPHSLSVEIASAEAEWERWAGDADNPMVARVAALPDAEREALRAQVLAALEARRAGGSIVLASEALLVTATR